MEHTHPVRHLLSQFPSRSVLAKQIGASVAKVHKWAQFDRIPAEHQQAVVIAAQARGLAHITPGWMLRVHAEHALRHPGGNVAPVRVAAE